MYTYCICCLFNGQAIPCMYREEVYSVLENRKETCTDIRTKIEKLKMATLSIVRVLT